jgi:Gp157 protein
MTVATAEKTKLTLYDISLEGMVIADILTENEGELTPDLEERLDALMREAPDRIEAAEMIRRQLEYNAAACAAEAKRLTERKNSFETQAERLEKRMVLALDAAFRGKVKTPRFTLWTQQAKGKVSIDLAEGFTVEMVHKDNPEIVKTEQSLDTVAIRAMYERDKSSLPESISVDAKEGDRYLRVR